MSGTEPNGERLSRKGLEELLDFCGRTGTIHGKAIRDMAKQDRTWAMNQLLARGYQYNTPDDCWHGPGPHTYEVQVELEPAKLPLEQYLDNLGRNGVIPSNALRGLHGETLEKALRYLIQHGYRHVGPGDCWLTDRNVVPANADAVPMGMPPGPSLSGAVAGSILREAAGIVEGARNTTHGEKERSFEAIAGLWNAFLAVRKDPKGPIRASDVAQMMSLLKKARAEQGTPVRDHFVDDAGYAAIAGELTVPEKS